MMNKLIIFWEYIFDIKDLFWFIAGILLPNIANKIRKYYLRTSARKRIAKSSDDLCSEGIVSLAHGDPYFIVRDDRVDLNTSMPEDNFHLAFPEQEKKKILEIKPKFFNTNWTLPEHFLNNQSRDEFIAEASSSLQIRTECFVNLLDESEIEIAESMLDRIRSGEPYFNGIMFGIANITPNREGVEERSTVDIDIYRSDYYTHRVMALVYRKVYKCNPLIAPSGLSKKYIDLRYFLTSLGMDTIIILADEYKHGGILFVRRSGNLYNMPEGKSVWHMTMNEAVSITDLDEDAQIVSLDKCVIRGIREELGINLRERKYKYSIHYSDLFLLQDPLETGISSYVIIHNLFFKEVELAYSSAKDRELESEGITMVPFEPEKINTFISKNDVTPACKYMIHMLLARSIRDPEIWDH